VTAVVVLAHVVAVDLARGGRPLTRLRAALATLAVVAAGAVLVVGLGADLVTVVVGALVAVAWAALVPAVGAPARAWPAAALGIVLAVAAVVPAPRPAGPLVDVWARTVPGDAGVPVTAGLAVVVVLALTRTANLVTRAALVHARRPGGPAGADAPAPEARRRPAAPDASVPGTSAPDAPAPDVPARGGWRLTVRGRDLAAVRPVEAPVPPGPVMRGGRHIGPLERVIVLVLALAGAFPVIAAVLAAKGVVRFPEISADRARGTKAEEFLVGSLVSWACAGAGVLLVRASGLG